MNASVSSDLQEICRGLKLPLATAKELIAYLTVKTIVGEKRGWELIPSSSLDKLLHKVLLETEITNSLEIDSTQRHLQSSWMD